MDEIQLVLVDLDNIRDKVPLDQVWFTSCSDTEAAPDGTPCVVVFAMNLFTADHHVTYESLGTLAERIAASIGSAPLLGFEVALTLIAKEAADVALERLFVEAPFAAHEGRVVALHLLTRDLGLRDSIGSKLPAKSYDREDAELTSSWRHRGKKKATARRAKKRGLLALGSSAKASAHLAVCTAELVADVGRRPVDITKGTTLSEIARAVSHRPGLLTQLGLTSRSCRGVDRMRELLSGGQPTLGPLEPADGVELCADVPAAVSHTEPSPSPLGAGAIRFHTPSGTLGTDLPTCVVLAAEGPYPTARGRLQDTAVLGRVNPERLQAAEIVKVRFSVCGRGLVAEARRRFGQSLEGWWWSSGRPESKPKVPGCDLDIKAAFTVHARCAIDVEGQSVILRAPFAGSVTARVERTTESLAPGKVDGIPVACLLPRSTAPGELRVAPIQNVSASLFKRRLPQHHQHFKHLRRLPLLVPA